MNATKISQTSRAIARVGSRLLEDVRLNTNQPVSFDEAEEEKVRLLLDREKHLIIEEEFLGNNETKIKLSVFSSLLDSNVYFIVIKNNTRSDLRVITLWTEFELIR